MFLDLYEIVKTYQMVLMYFTLKPLLSRQHARHFQVTKLGRNVCCASFVVLHNIS